MTEMFKLPNLGLFVTVFKAGVVVGVFVGAAAGALTGAAGGLLTAPSSGRKLRAKIKEDAEKGLQTLSQNSEKLKEHGRELVDKISHQFESFSINGSDLHNEESEEEIDTEEPLSENSDQMSSRRNNGKNGRRRRRSA